MPNHDKFKIREEVAMVPMCTGSRMLHLEGGQKIWEFLT